MTREEIETTAYPSIISRNPTPYTRTAILGVYRPNAHRAMFDTKGAWPKVKVLLLWADMSILYCPWGAKVLSDALAEPAVEGMQRRDVEIMRLEEANHFVSADDLLKCMVMTWRFQFHWEHPEKMLGILAKHMAS